MKPNLYPILRNEASDFILVSLFAQLNWFNTLTLIKIRNDLILWSHLELQEKNNPTKLCELFFVAFKLYSKDKNNKINKNKFLPV